MEMGWDKSLNATNLDLLSHSICLAADLESESEEETSVMSESDPVSQHWFN